MLVEYRLFVRYFDDRADRCILPRIASSSVGQAETPQTALGP